MFFGTDPSPDNSELVITPVVETSYDPGMLEYNTIYYWRIDSQNERGTVRGNVWQFTTASRPRPKPEKAATPTPAHEATEVPIRNTSLGWAAVSTATSYLVYFGTVASPGSDERQGWQSGTTFDPPDLLEYETRYCWRIDTRNEGGITTGDVWCFTTEGPDRVSAWSPRGAVPGEFANMVRALQCCEAKAGGVPLPFRASVGSARNRWRSVCRADIL